MKHLILLIALVLAAGCADESRPHEKINGSWTSNLMNATIDFEAGTYTVVALGQRDVNDLELVEEGEGYVIFLSDTTQITAQIHGPDEITLSKRGGMPIRLQRLESE